MTTDLRNELAWALDTTATPPHVSRGTERLHVTREYARLHALLRAVDEALRGWRPVRSDV